MDNKLIAKLLSKGGFKESSIVLESGRVSAEKNSAVSGVGRKGGTTQSSSPVESGSGSEEVGNATTVMATQSGMNSASKGSVRSLVTQLGK